MTPVYGLVRWVYYLAESILTPLIDPASSKSPGVTLRLPRLEKRLSVPSNGQYIAAT